MRLVTIITPLYNCKTIFSATLKSVINQTYKNYEWIIIDDCSTDGSYELVKSFALNYHFIKLLRTEINSGAAIARNLGIKEAEGRFIAFLDADDLWRPEKLEKQLKFMLENDISFSYGDYDVLYPDGTTKTFSPKKKAVTYKDLLKTCDIGCLTVMFDTKKLGKVYFSIDSPKREDHAMWLDITKSGVLAYKLPESLATYRLSEQSISSNKIRMLKYQYLMYRKHLRLNPIKSFWYTLAVTLNKIFKKY